MWKIDVKVVKKIAIMQLVAMVLLCGMVGCSNPKMKVVQKAAKPTTDDCFI